MNRARRSTAGAPAAKRSRRIEQGNDEDFFSSLADVCLRSVFSHLDWLSFNTMRNVSQRMRLVLNGCEEPKKEVLDLTISHDAHGFRVCLHSYPFSDDTGSQVYSLLSYTVAVPFHGYITHKRSSIRRNMIYPTAYSTCDVISSCGSHILPDLVFDVVQEHCNRFIFEKLRFIGLVIDNNLIDLFKSKCAFPRQAVEFMYCKIDESLRSKKLSEFFLSMKGRKAKFEFHEIKRQLFDASFLRQFSADSTDCYLELEYQYQLTWPLHDGMLPVISRFSTLRLHSIELNPDQLIMLISDRLEHSRPEGQWEFTLTSKITEQHIAQFAKKKFVVRKQGPEEGEASSTRIQNDHVVCTLDVSPSFRCFRTSIRFAVV